MDKTHLNLKNNVKYFRKSAGYSQQELAEKCEISTSFVAEIEIGRRSPSLKTMILIAGVLGIETYMLLIDKENNESDSINNFSRKLLSRIEKDIKDLKGRV